MKKVMNLLTEMDANVLSTAKRDNRRPNDRVTD
jgi:hypothetical protein